jgi:hypothetical protein
MCKLCICINNNQDFIIDNYISNNVLDSIDIDENITIHTYNMEGVKTRNEYGEIVDADNQYEVTVDIEISKCRKIEKLPTIIDNQNRNIMIFLKKLRNFKELDGNHININNMDGISIEKCSNLDTIKNISKIESLSIDSCNSLKNIENITDIEFIKIDDCKNIEIIKNMSNINHIVFNTIMVSKMMNIHNISFIQIDIVHEVTLDMYEEYDEDEYDMDDNIYNTYIKFKDLDKDISKILKHFIILDSHKRPSIISIDDNNYDIINNISDDIGLLI